MEKNGQQNATFIEWTLKLFLPFEKKINFMTWGIYLKNSSDSQVKQTKIMQIHASWLHSTAITLGTRVCVCQNNLLMPRNRGQNKTMWAALLTCQFIEMRQLICWLSHFGNCGKVGEKCKIIVTNTVYNLHSTHMLHDIKRVVNVLIHANKS